MKKVAIVGAGQAGLQLAIGLAKENYQITVFSDRSGQDIASGRIMSNQAMFATALQYENELALDFWGSSCPDNTSITLSLSQNAKQLINWKSILNKPFKSIDQRLKFPKWMQEFEALEGTLIVKKIDSNDLEAITNENDLTIISTGKQELSSLFARDEKKSIHTQPQRSLMCLYVNGIIPEEDQGIRVNIVPQMGEFFIMPGLTFSGPCEMMLFEAMPQSEFDSWKPTDPSDICLNKAIALLEKFLPWEAQRCKHAKLTDPQAVLVGKYTPIIRHPIAILPSKSLVLGMGDAVVLNDPIAGQGANNASKCAKIYLDSILSNQSGLFDEAWMQTTFNKFWDEAQWSTKLSNMLLQPPSKEFLTVLERSKIDSDYSTHLASAFEDPKTFFSWLSELDKSDLGDTK